MRVSCKPTQETRFAFAAGTSNQHPLGLFTASLFFPLLTTNEASCENENRRHRLISLSGCVDIAPVDRFFSGVNIDRRLQDRCDEVRCGGAGLGVR